MTLQFVAKPDKESAPLREGGVISKQASSTRRRLRRCAQRRFEDRWVGVVAAGHPLTRGRVTSASLCSAGHVHVLRRGLHSTDIDDAVRAEGIDRRVAIIVHGFAAALSLARETELVATVPERHTAGLRQGMHVFALPFQMAPFTISMLWHPRMDGDLAHGWLRGQLRKVCGKGARK